ncbi:hypothetical protein [Caenimonas koreensis]|uniref:hypothetical protein n=1 Tax=Caenimonas koreensis TaxID=367474 RepID=UPI00378366D2
MPATGGEVLLSIDRPASHATDGLPPLRLHVAPARLDEDTGLNERDAQPAAAAGNPAADAAARAAKNRAKKERAKKKRAKEKASDQQGVQFSLVRAVREFRAPLGCDPAALYLNRDGEGNFSFQNAPLSEDEVLALDSSLQIALCDELWFAHRRLPFTQQWELMHEAEGFAFLRVTRGVATYKDALELAEEISRVAQLQTPQQLREYCTQLIKPGMQQFTKTQLAEQRADLLVGHVAQVCDLLPLAIGVLFDDFETEQAPEVSRARSRSEVVEILSRMTLCSTTSISALAGLLRSAHDDETVSE